MYDRATGAQQKANAAVDSITDVMMQIPNLEKTVDSLKGNGVGPDVTLDGVTEQGQLSLLLHFCLSSMCSIPMSSCMRLLKGLFDAG